ncbi:hypothetical protein [Salinimicrobium sp. TH3]|uniref:hypothetical protein n=1 Tax=Salinimicrobium sp. TH3 TaxID=2997342 RepID=UPI0022754DC3|nr:hypothetical protein [Salinimicrobium sp. TH3]MCY2687381.1 hypothetical protein [Salinimicrobium sp. TH3]
MKNLKLLLVVFAMIISSTVSAREIKSLANPDSVSVEIEKILENVKLANECEPLEVTVFFSVSEDQKIQSLSVSSPHGEVNEYIQKQLSNRLLPAESWMKGRIYELTVVKKVS